MMGRCFIVVGPENAGNRLIAALLIRAGCYGRATADPDWRFNQDIPDEESPSPSVIIRSFPHGGEWPDLSHIYDTLRQRGIDPFFLVSCRDWSASDIGREERGEIFGPRVQMEAYRRIFGTMPEDAPFRMIPYESLVLHPDNAVQYLMEALDLPWIPGSVHVEGVERPIADENAARYKVPRIPTGQTFRELSPALTWSVRDGIGFYPVHGASPYNDSYWRKYQGYATSPMGKRLTAARVEFVNRFWDEALCDVGIGCGDFIEKRGTERTTGFDVNPRGIQWLKDAGVFLDPNREDVTAASFWDSLEHIQDPRAILSHVNRWVFLSIPIFKGPDHVLMSKHFRTDEHYWYFTDNGIRAFFKRQGFSLVETASFEMDLGREDIKTYAFRRG